MKRALGVFTGIGLLLVALGLAAGWFYAGEIERGALATDGPPPPFDLIVTGIDDGVVTLRPDATGRDNGDLQRPGRFGIRSAGGTGAVGDIVRRDGDEVTRELIFFNSDIAIGDEVRLRAMSFSGDPLSVHGIAFDEVAFESDVGRFGAWRTDGGSGTWAIFVHGRTADRKESLGVLPVLVALGMPTLVIQYRNDEGVAPSASGFYDFGLSEWRDLEAAVRYAVDHGAEGVVLIGYSMGGSIVLSFVYHSPLADRVRAVVLDSPVLDFGAVIDFAGEQRGVPEILTRLGKATAAVRSDVAWDELNYLDRVDELSVPVLLFHGAADRIVPISTSDALAAARPDLVTYVRLDDVGHVRGWNVDKGMYERALAEFLAPVVNAGGEGTMTR